MFRPLQALVVSLALTFLCATAPSCAAADEVPPQRMSVQQFVASLHFQDGKITLPDGIATLDLPESLRYLPPADTERMLVDAWGNPPGNKTLGMIVPAGVSPVSNAGWGVVITYDKDGHVKDGDADSIKYDDLLKQMQDGVADNNKARKEHGYEAMTLVGWAETPRYDKQSHKLYWAKELAVQGAPEHTLNYNIRVLGRDGVLVLNAIAGMSQIGAIKTEMQRVTAVADFTDGHRYADFNGSTDKVAEYGLAALVAGGVAAKLGLFGKLVALLVVFKKLILFGLVAAGAGFMKLFKRGKKTVPEAAPAAVSLDKPGKVNLEK